MKKTCFVVMGFGKKMDYRNSKEIDLDLIYKQVIKRLFDSDFKDYQLIRADEISGSEIIDISMYSLLIKSDLVIADITTSNENALYELGIRHALKPFSTIIMMQKSDKGSIPFDLSHNRILTYDDYGEYLDEDEAANIRKLLKEFVRASQENKTDSPLYTYLPNVTPPSLDDSDYEKILEKALHKEQTIFNYIEQANSLKKQNNFEDSVEIWNKLHDAIPNNDYVTQQLAFAIYKAKKPNETIALQKALEVIMTLAPNTSLDLETLGITGAIYKRLYKVNNNFDYLEEAIKMYQRGYTKECYIRALDYDSKTYDAKLCLLNHQIIDEPLTAEEEMIALKNVLRGKRKFILTNIEARYVGYQKHNEEKAIEILDNVPKNFRDKQWYAVKRQLLENSIRKHSLAKRDILANEYTKELKKLDDVVEQKYGNINLREVDLLPDM